MRRIVFVTFVPPTNTRGARWRAKCLMTDTKVAVPQEYSMSSFQNAVRATLKYVELRTDYTPERVLVSYLGSTHKNEYAFSVVGINAGEPPPKFTLFSELLKG